MTGIVRNSTKYQEIIRNKKNQFCNLPYKNFFSVLQLSSNSVFLRKNEDYTN